MKSISIVMATLNSMRTIEQSLSSIVEQDYPKDLLEILVIDGGSTDGTRELAKKFGARVIDNPQVEPVSAKLIGMREAKNELLMHLDSDEVLLSKDALFKRSQAFEKNPDVQMVFSQGYVNPPSANFATRYINEFGDPFSMYYYRLSKDHRFHLPDLRGKLRLVSENDSYVIFEVKPGDHLILENAALGNVINIGFFRQNFPELCARPDGPVHFFYHMQSLTQKFGVIKEDGVMHHSADNWRGFLRKIRWRVVNNVFRDGKLEHAGFNRRHHFDFFAVRARKYLYPFYAFLIVPVALDSLYLVWTRRDVKFINHCLLTWYTAALILGMMALKAMGFQPTRTGYGQARVIGKKPLSPTNDVRRQRLP
jgi:glycosyltransferase involved in cell wall biosynthesis